MEIITKAFHINKDGKKNIVFSPVDGNELKRIEKLIKHGERYTVDVHRPQAGNHLKQLQAVTRYLYDNFRGSKPRQIETFREAITIEVGATVVRKQSGKTYERAMSWSSKKSDQDEFMKRIYNPVMDFAEKYLEFKNRERLIVESMQHAGYNYDEKKVIV